MLLRSAPPAVVTLAVALVAALPALGSCLAIAANDTTSQFEDVAAVQIATSISNGLSDELEFEVPPGTRSVLIEVRGRTGRYYLAKFTSPSGVDLVESGGFVTREARSVPGLVDWMYPNSPGTAVEPGTYSFIVRAEDGAGDHLGSEDIDVRVYLAADGGLSDSCAITLDVLVTDDAIAPDDSSVAVDWLVGQVATIFGSAGIEVANYTTSRLAQSPGTIDLLTDPHAATRVHELIRASIDAGLSRERSVRVILVRSLGPSIRGFSMGLPGPLDGDRATSAVLVATESFVGVDGYLELDQMVATIAHEVGHYLGLYHTSERDGRRHDPITDTPECSAEGCPDEFHSNLMTPGGGPERMVLSPGQVTVIRRHPLCHRPAG